jgi:parallel beta-helix repeat protein
MDGELCPSNICSDVEQQGSEYSYSVEHFTEYSVGGDEKIFDSKDVSCGDVLTSNTVLTSDLTCAGDGLIIGANNVVLDCAGHTITYGTTEEGIGVDLTDSSGSTVKNCVIVKNSMVGYSNRGIRLYNSANSLIEDNEVQTGGQGNTGIGISKSDNSIIQLNLITNNAQLTKSISLGGDQENIQIKNNEINSNGVDSLSIRIDSDSLNVNVSNNIINSGSDSIELGIGGGSHPEGTIIEDNTITANGYDLIINANIDDVTLIDQDINKYDINNAKFKIKKNGIGEVWFTERLTASGTNLDEDVKIEDNDISVDVVNKPGLNVSGTIYLYDPNTFAFGPPYNPIKDGSICDEPFGDICTNFEYEDDEFSFDVSEMALEYKVEGTYAPLPWVSVSPEAGPEGTDVEVNISWLYADVGDEFTIVFDEYEVESFNYPDIGEANSFIVDIVVPSIPTGEYEVGIKDRPDVGKDIFTVNSLPTSIVPTKEVEESDEEDGKIIKVGEKKETKAKDIEKEINVQNEKIETVERPETLSSNNKGFYSFYI